MIGFKTARRNIDIPLHAVFKDSLSQSMHIEQKTRFPTLFCLDDFLTYGWSTPRCRMEPYSDSSSYCYPTNVGYYSFRMHDIWFAFNPRTQRPLMIASLIKKINSATSFTMHLALLIRTVQLLFPTDKNEDDVPKLSTEINPHLDRANFVMGFLWAMRKRAHSHLSRNQAYRNLTNPNRSLLGLMNQILGPNCERIQINIEAQAIQIWPGETAQVLHRDDLKYPVQERILQFMCLRVTCNAPRRNGCTRIALGSHKWEDPKRKATDAEISYAEMRQQTMVLSDRLFMEEEKIVLLRRASVLLQAIAWAAD